MSEPIVDSSPFTHLASAGQLALLQVLGPTVSIPDEVLREILAKGEDDPAVIAVESIRWLIRIGPTELVPEIEQWGLGAGEAAVLSRALSQPGSIVVLDDGRARQVAAKLGLSMIGTLGVVVRARQRGLIPAARPVVELLVRNGMYLSSATLESALGLIGE